MTTDDFNALNLLSKTLGLHATWFNMAVSTMANVLVAGYTPAVFRFSADVKDPVKTQVYLRSDEISSGDITHGNIIYGLKPSTLIYSVPATVSQPGGYLFGNCNVITSGATFYWQFVCIAPSNCVGMVSGIYKTYWQ